MEGSLYELSLGKIFEFAKDPFCKKLLYAQLPSPVKWDLFQWIMIAKENAENTNFSFHFVNGLLVGLTLYKIHSRGNLLTILEILLSMNSDLECLELIDVCDEFVKEEEISNCLGKVLRKSPNLLYFHCGIPFNLKALRNCKKLQHLKLCFCPNQPWYDFLEVKNGFPQQQFCLNSFTVCSYSIRTLQIEDIGCNWRASYPNYVEDLLKILMLCPELTAVGNRERNEIEKHIYRKLGRSSEDLPPSFKLQECIWQQLLDVEEGTFMRSYAKTVPLRMAVATYPEVEKLSVIMNHEFSLIPLLHLNNLAYLSISYSVPTLNYFSVEIAPTLMSIGHRLKYLNLLAIDNLSINFLRAYLPNLKYLVSHCELCVNPYAEIENFYNLEELTLDSITIPDKTEKSLEILLSKCVNLRSLKLCTDFSRQLTDNRLNKILKSNSF
ncbi:uncharacterized protein CEXT_316601 [Caerostris extrusa]|uniref:Uncharacterized protein n=1 Tax=Caerostris extrusa TaxID=172846 RepID=A0AAV4REW6_CAEEX|nr:uncharacterized protein CEXT_316601 [Caerostris extrusa]